MPLIWIAVGLLVLWILAIVMFHVVSVLFHLFLLVILALVVWHVVARRRRH